MSFIIPFKVTLQRQKRPPSTHRFRGRYSFSEMQTVLSHLWGGAPQKLLIEYTDDESDVIHVASDFEWEEAVRLHSNRLNSMNIDAPLKLKVSKASLKKPVKEDDVPQLPTLNHDEEDEAVPRVTVPQIDVSNCGQPKTFALHFQHDSDKNALALLSSLYSCDAVKELLNPFSLVDFSAVVARTLDPVGLEVHLDIHIRELRNAVVVESSLMMDQKTYGRAVEILLYAKSLFPEDKIVRYNLSCALCLNADRSLALDELEAAVRCGYDNGKHMRDDPDLSAIASEPRFLQLVASLAPQETHPVPPVVETPVLVPTVVVEVEPTNPHVLALLAVFPSLSLDQATEALQRSNNNVHVAVNRLLGY